MQPYPPQATPPETRPWGLLFGLYIGAGYGAISVLVNSIFNALLAKLTDYSTLSNMVFALWLIHILLAIALSIALFFVGRTAAKRSHRAGSGTQVGLVVTVLYVLFYLLTLFIGKWQSLYDALNFTVYTGLFALLTSLFLIYLGFVAGLVGRAEQQQQRSIGTLYALGTIFTLSAIISLSNIGLLNYFSGNGVLGNYTSGPGGLGDYLGAEVVIVAVACLVVTVILSFIIWIKVLIEYSHVQAWGAFMLTIFFSGIMLLVYLINGAHAPQAVSYIVMQPGAYPPVAPPVAPAYPPYVPPALEVQAVAPPVQPPNADAIAVLQQRYARGEIDATTYNQMITTLTRTM